jgi:hypothetical protein
MDTRNGNMYPSREAAIAAGVPESDVVQGRIVTFTSGPFKDRTYLSTAKGLIRIRKKTFTNPFKRNLPSMKRERAL